MNDKVEIMVIKIGVHSYGLIIDKVKEVIRKTDFIHLSEKFSLYIVGLMIKENIQIPIIDLHRKYNITPVTECKTLIVVSLSDRLLAFFVDEIEGILNVPYKCIYPVPIIIKNGENQSIYKIADTGERLISLINPEQLLSEQERNHCFASNNMY